MKTDIWQTDREKAEVLPCGLKVLKGMAINGKPLVSIWKPKAINPYANYYFPTEQARDNYIEMEIKSFKDHKERVLKNKLESNGTQENLDTVKAGDIFHWSWGYEQTNCDYYQIIAKKGHRLTLREICQRTVEGTAYPHGMADMRLPIKDSFVEDSKPFDKIVKFSNGKPYISMRFGWCDLWDGKANYCSWYG